MKTVLKTVLCQVVLVVLLTPCVWADEVEDAVAEGMEYYKQGDFSSAAGSLDYAAQLIRQKKGGELEGLLPEPLPGWTAEAASSEAAGAAMFGGGVSAERVYEKENSTLTIRIVADSPMLQAVMMMLTNPAVAASSGGKLKKINGQKALINYDTEAGGGEIQIAVGGRVLVTVEGTDVSQEVLEEYAAALDYQKVAGL